MPTFSRKLATFSKKNAEFSIKISESIKSRQIVQIRQNRRIFFFRLNRSNPLKSSNSFFSFKSFKSIIKSYIIKNS